MVALSASAWNRRATGVVPKDCGETEGMLLLLLSMVPSQGDVCALGKLHGVEAALGNPVHGDVIALGKHGEGAALGTLADPSRTAQIP